MPSIQVLACSARTVSILVSPPGTQHGLQRPLEWALSHDTGASKKKSVQSGVAYSAGIFLEGLEPRTRYRLSTPIGSLDFETERCAGRIEASDFGVSPNNHDNSQAFEAAIEATPDGGTLRVAAGFYNTRPLFLKSHMTLQLDEGATIAALGDRSDWTILPAFGEQEQVLGTWEGLAEPCYSAVITAIDCTNLKLTGRGTIDGGGNRGDWWEWPKATRNGARRPRTIHMVGCSNLSLTGLTVCNSPSWTIHPYMCTDLHSSNLKIMNPPDSPNTDGFNPECCEKVEMIALHFSVGDDCIAIKAGKRGPAEQTVLAPTRDIYIAHCLMERGHGAIVIGSEMSGGVYNVAVNNCEFLETDRGLRLKTRRGRGGVIDGLRLHDVQMRNVPTPIAVNAFYFCDADGKTDWVQSREPARVDETTPVIRNISVENVTAHNVTTVAVAVLGLPEAPIRDITISQMIVSFAPAAETSPEVPLMALHVPPMHHQRTWTEFAEVEGDVTVLAPDTA